MPVILTLDFEDKYSLYDYKSKKIIATEGENLTVFRKRTPATRLNDWAHYNGKDFYLQHVEEGVFFELDNKKYLIDHKGKVYNDEKMIILGKNKEKNFAALSINEDYKINLLTSNVEDFNLEVVKQWAENPYAFTLLNANTPVTYGSDIDTSARFDSSLLFDKNDVIESVISYFDKQKNSLNKAQIKQEKKNCIISIIENLNNNCENIEEKIAQNKDTAIEYTNKINELNIKKEKKERRNFDRLLNDAKKQVNVANYSIDFYTAFKNETKELNEMISQNKKENKNENENFLNKNTNEEIVM